MYFVVCFENNFHVSEMDGSLLDLSDRGLIKLEIPAGDKTRAVIADRNSITRIENLEDYPSIRQVQKTLVTWLKVFIFASVFSNGIQVISDLS